MVIWHYLKKLLLNFFKSVIIFLIITLQRAVRVWFGLRSRLIPSLNNPRPPLGFLPRSSFPPPYSVYGLSLIFSLHSYFIIRLGQCMVKYELSKSAVVNTNSSQQIFKNHLLLALDFWKPVG